MTESDLTDDDEVVAACMSGELSRQIARLEPPFQGSLCRTREAGIERRRACMLSFEFFIVESSGILSLLTSVIFSPPLPSKLR